ncbi:MAG: hypothetical protein U0984_00335 [Prosthecobacter sp.]|nr:hypothetical protein [Prosthecobacter sp.]
MNPPQDHSTPAAPAPAPLPAEPPPPLGGPTAPEQSVQQQQAPPPTQPPTQPPTLTSISISISISISTPPKWRFVAPTPVFRKLRCYAIDPGLVGSLETEPISEVTIQLPWQPLKPGPQDDYLEVIDVDPASGCFYEPVKLDDPALLAQDGLPLSEGTPQFHQQMVYAVARLTILNFENALGRRTLWRHQTHPQKPHDDSLFCERLRIYPHALRECNAYYTPQRIALLFGYFRAAANDPGRHMAGGMVFSCLSHDIIAHETTHALLDGMNRNFLCPSNPDVHAFHEAFADIVALFQHFTFPEIVCHQMQATHGDIASQESVLSELAGQFGRGVGLRGALRGYIGQRVDDKWVRKQPDPAAYATTKEAHKLGAILVSAVFDAFLAIYRHRTADLLRLATGGGGILQPGAIHPDLAARLAEEAAKAARHVLTMCVRAIDYCPQMDITFGEFLRAVITADSDVVVNDDKNYRIAFLEAFQRHGIYPRDVPTLSIESLLWRGWDDDPKGQPSGLLTGQLLAVRKYVGSTIFFKDRKQHFNMERNLRATLHKRLKKCFNSPKAGADDAAYLGVNKDKPFEVRTARIAFRATPDGGTVPQLLVGLYQETEIPVDNLAPNGAKMLFEGGCTIIADLYARKIKYCVRKSIASTERQMRQQKFAAAAHACLRATYFDFRDEKEPIASIHRA